MLSHLIYVSQRKPLCTGAEIQKILESCTKNNGKEDITGVQLYSQTQFIQCLEGNYRDIIKLYSKIQTDERHKSPVLIASTPNLCQVISVMAHGSPELKWQHRIHHQA